MATITKLPSGKWRAQVRRAGHSHRSKTFDKKFDAVKWARDEEGSDRQRDEAPAELLTTFGDLIDVYVEQTGDAMGFRKGEWLKVLRKTQGDKRLAEMTATMFLEYAKEREAKGIGPATIAYGLAYMHQVLKVAPVLFDDERIAVVAASVASGLVAARTMLTRQGRVGSPRKRERRPTEAELRIMRTALNTYCARRDVGQKPMWDMARFAIATTMRIGEITSIRWEDFDEEGRTILIRNRKHPSKKRGNHQRVPLLSGHATVLGEVVDPVKIILSQPGADKRRGFIFPYSPAAVSIVWHRVADKSGIADLRFHDLRHDAVSRMFEYGFSIPEVALCSGHSSWEHLKRYTNLKPEFLHNKLEKMRILA